jgi:uncharacterized RDD family membrane protein YckC
MMKNLVVKRALAFGIDYLIIAAYAMFLFGIASFFIEVGNFNPIKGPIIGFITLTLPVFLYFLLTEKSKHKATIGKRAMNISVSDHQPGVKGNIFIRNFVKFLPWEIAHLGVHWIVHYSNEKLDPPIWIWIALILPQVVVAGYMISILVYRGGYSIYDNIAKTKIVTNSVRVGNAIASTPFFGVTRHAKHLSQKNDIQFSRI